MNSDQIHKIISSAQECINIEQTALQRLQETINLSFAEAVMHLNQCKGRIVITGIGKSAIIAQKIVATFNSTGTQSIYMHAADAIHGDLGMIHNQDVVICISKSGETPEIKALIPLVKNLGSRLQCIVSNLDSTLARQSDDVYYVPIDQEAEPNNLAPTASTTAQLALGDALAVALLSLKGFTAQDFAQYHPGGSLGKQLYLKVSDLSHTHLAPVVMPTDSIRAVILEMTKKRLGATAVCDKENKLKGMITDGDLRRMLDKNENISSLQAQNIMNPNPKTIHADELAIEAFRLMQAHSITQLIVIKDDQYYGMIHLHDLIKEGFI
ncbi:MAG TPA: KpsF/GutQ family sugar-phosphate isomerase [Saprospiraceae bacterium]|nr:KpsF/GutQ family sugar-phosphate isomerase [Saprospiraceae bacterium]